MPRGRGCPGARDPARRVWRRRRLDEAQPWVDGVLPGGVRLHADPAARGGGGHAPQPAGATVASRSGVDGLRALGAVGDVVAGAATGRGRSAVLPRRRRHRSGQDHGARCAARPSAGPEERSSWSRTCVSSRRHHPHVVPAAGPHSQRRGRRRRDAGRPGAAGAADAAGPSRRRVRCGELRSASCCPRSTPVTTAEPGPCTPTGSSRPRRASRPWALWPGWAADAVHAQLRGAVQVVVDVARVGPDPLRPGRRGDALDRDGGGRRRGAGRCCRAVGFWAAAVAPRVRTRTSTRWGGPGCGTARRAARGSAGREGCRGPDVGSGRGRAAPWPAWRRAARQAAGWHERACLDRRRARQCSPWRRGRVVDRTPPVGVRAGGDAGPDGAPVEPPGAVVLAAVRKVLVARGAVPAGPSRVGGRLRRAGGGGSRLPGYPPTEAARLACAVGGRPPIPALSGRLGGAAGRRGGRRARAVGDGLCRGGVRGLRPDLPRRGVAADRGVRRAPRHLPPALRPRCSGSGPPADERRDRSRGRSARLDVAAHPAATLRSAGRSPARPPVGRACTRHQRRGRRARRRTLPDGAGWLWSRRLLASVAATCGASADVVRCRPLPHGRRGLVSGHPPWPAGHGRRPDLDG